MCWLLNCPAPMTSNWANGLLMVLNYRAGSGRKVALARAYMRDAQLLILDEPTSALDARAEYNVFERFR